MPPHKSRSPVPQTQKKKEVKKAAGRQRTVDIIVILFCFLGAAVSFFLFWRDLSLTLTKQNEAPVAVIRFKKNTAQRRFGNRVAWDSLKRDSPIYSGDVIHTANLAEATIFFPNGENSVDIGENTLIQVFVDKTSTRIELSSGVVNINAGNNSSELLLLSSGVAVDIEAFSNVSAAGNMNGAGLKVNKGSARLVNSKGLDIETSAGSTLALDSAGKLINSAEVSALSPAPSAYYVTNDDEMSVTFSWNTANFEPGDTIYFQIAADQRFSGLIESANAGVSSSRTVNLKPGIYWWRVFAAKLMPGETAPPASEFTIASKFTIVAAEIPQVITPAAGSLIPLRPAVHFQWSTDENLNLYTVQVSSDPQMQNPVFQHNVQGDSLNYEGLGAGIWYWQVKRLYPAEWEGLANVQADSVPAVFTISSTEEEVTAPSLTMPDDVAFVNVGPDAKSVLFSWKSGDSNSDYMFEVADNLDFQDPLIKTPVRNNYYSLDPASMHLESGTYFWRVSLTDGEFWSITRQFNAVENLIVFESVFPPDNYSVSETRFEDIRFQWNSNLETPSHFQLARDSGFSTLLIDEAVEETALQMSGRFGPFAAGDYYWRLTNVINDKDIKSAVRRIVIQSSSRITLENPPDGAEIDGLSAVHGETVVTWESSEPLLNARLILFRDGAPVFEQENPGRTINLPPLSSGSYTWTIQAETTGGFDISPQTPSSFRVAPVSRLPAPTGLSPARGKSFGAEELRATRNINFTWNRVTGANAYILRVYRAGSGRAIVSTNPLRTPAYTLSDLTLLDADEFVWQVEAVLVSSEGGIEQRGIIAESRFSIDISMPSAPKLPDEEVYGR